MTGDSTQLSLPPEILAPLSRRWTEAEAFEYCSQLTAGHYENFPVGSLLVPPDVQPAIHSLYAFMRTADDFSDENRRPGDEGERLAWLKSWGRLLDDAQRGQAQHPIFIAVRRTLDQYRLPVQWLKDLLHAFAMDCTVRRYETFEDVMGYCRYSANPVGRLILTLFGYRDEERYRWSDSICTGLQLANHWQDVRLDLEKDRIYLPQEDMLQQGVTEADLREGRLSRAFQSVMALEIARTRTCFSEGRPLPESVRGRLRWELRLTWQGGMRVLEKIERAGYDVFRRRPQVTKLDWLFLAARASVTSLIRRP